MADTFTSADFKPEHVARHRVYCDTCRRMTRIVVIPETYAAVCDPNPTCEACGADFERPVIAQVPQVTP